jgi:hypothetical protein
MRARSNKVGFTTRDMTRTAVATERLCKHVSAETNSRNNRRAVSSVRSVPRGYKKDKEGRLSQSSSRVPSELL